MSLNIVRLAPGWQKTDPTHCPKCGLSITNISGMKRGTLRHENRTKEAVRIMVCARCEVGIARWDDKILTLDAATEASLPAEARDALRETRNDLRLAKAIGRVVVPPTGP